MTTSPPKTITYSPGMRVSEPCIVSAMPSDAYHGDPCVGPSVSSTGLRTIWNSSPLHYWAFSPYNPDRIPPRQSEAFDLGRAAHHWLLGEADFAGHFVISPYEDFRSKEARAWRDAEQLAGRTVLKAEQMDAVRGMRDGLMRHPLVSAGILDGEIERSLFALDEKRGVWLRSRPDVVPNASGDYVDLKTTTTVDRDEIARSIATYGYTMQAGLLRRVCRMLGMPFTSFSFVFVEKTPPYCARVVVLKDHELDRGERQIEAALDLFAAGMTTGMWPGPGESDDAEWIESPAWAQTRADERLAYHAAQKEPAT